MEAKAYRVRVRGAVLQEGHGLVVARLFERLPDTELGARADAQRRLRRASKLVLHVDARCVTSMEHHNYMWDSQGLSRAGALTPQPKAPNLAHDTLHPEP